MSWEYMPEVEYNSWQAEKFTKQAQARVFPYLAYKKIDESQQEPTLPEAPPDTGPDIRGGHIIGDRFTGQPTTQSYEETGVPVGTPGAFGRPLSGPLEVAAELARPLQTGFNIGGSLSPSIGPAARTVAQEAGRFGPFSERLGFVPQFPGRKLPPGMTEQQLNEAIARGIAEGLPADEAAAAASSQTTGLLSSGVPEGFPSTTVGEGRVPMWQRGPTEGPQSIPPTSSGAPELQAQMARGGFEGLPADEAASAMADQTRRLMAGGQPEGLPSLTVGRGRAPVWEGVEGAAPSGQDITGAPSRGIASEWQPSGREVGGIERMQPLEPGPTPLERVREALTPDQTDAITRLRKGVQTKVAEWFDSNQPLAILEKETGVPVHQSAQSVPHMKMAGLDKVETEAEPILQKLGSNGIKDLQEYMSIERNADILQPRPGSRLPGGLRGAGDVATARTQLKAELGPERYQQVQGAANALYDANRKNILGPLNDEGFFTDEAYQAITVNNPHYLDYHRAEHEIDGALKMTGTNKPVANVSSSGINPLTLVGSEAKLDEPLMRTLAQYVTTPTRIARNQTARMLHQALDSKGMAQVLKDGESFTPTTERGIVSYFSNGQDGGVKGQLVHIIVPEPFAQVAKGAEAEATNWLTTTLMKGASVFRAAATNYSPVFAIRNLIKDAQTGAIQNGWGTILSKEYIQAWVAAITKNATFHEAAQAGALTGIIDTNKSVQSVLGNVGKRKIWEVPVQSVSDFVLFAPRLLSAINSASERVTRIAAFQRAIDKGAPGLTAGNIGADATVDFSKSGYLGKIVNQLIPFMNAGIQGTTNVLKVIKNHPEQAALRAAPFVGASILVDTWNRQFESSASIPEEYYKWSWPLVIGEGTENPDPKNPTAPAQKYPIFIPIPKSPAVDVLTFPAEIALGYLRSTKDTSIAEQVLASAMGYFKTISPVEMSALGVIPPPFSSAAQAATNFDAFQERPIIPRGEQEKPSEEQFGPETSKLAVALGTASSVKISPRMIDFIINDYTAGAGKFVSGMMGAALGALGYNPQVPGEARKQPLTDTQQLSHAPFVSGFIRTANTQQDTQAWDKLDKITMDTKREFANLPETRRLGMNMGQVGESIDGQMLTMPQRQEYQRMTADVLAPSIQGLVASDYFKKAADPDKIKMMERARALAGQYVRPYILPEDGQKPYAAQKNPEVGQAIATRVVAERVYDTIPKYHPELGLSGPQLEQITATIDRMKKNEAQMPAQYKQYAFQFAYEMEQKAGTDGNTLQYAVAFMRSPGKYENPVRKQFRDKFLGGIDVESAY